MRAPLLREVTVPVRTLCALIQLLVDQCPAMGQRHMLRILKVGEELHRHRHALAGVPVRSVIRQPAA
jgi:hypothetical protein